MDGMNLKEYIGLYNRLSTEDGLRWRDVLSRFGGAIASSFEDGKSSSPIARFSAFMGDSLGPYGVNVDKLPAGSVAITGPGVVYNLGAGIAWGGFSIVESREGLAANNPDWCKIPIEKADAMVPWIVQEGGALYELPKTGDPPHNAIAVSGCFPLVSQGIPLSPEDVFSLIATDTRHAIRGIYGEGVTAALHYELCLCTLASPRYVWEALKRQGPLTVPEGSVQPQTYERIGQINAALEQDGVYSPIGGSKTQLSVDSKGDITLSRVVPARYSHLCLGITKEQELVILQVGGLMPSGQSGHNGLTFAELFELARHVASVFRLTTLQVLNQGRDVINNVVIFSGGVIDTNKGGGGSLLNPDRIRVNRKSQVVPHIGIIPTY